MKESKRLRKESSENDKSIYTSEERRRLRINADIQLAILENLEMILEEIKLKEKP